MYKLTVLKAEIVSRILEFGIKPLIDVDIYYIKEQKQINLLVHYMLQ